MELPLSEQTAASASGRHEGVEAGGPQAWQVTQGICFFKRSDDPSSAKIVKVKRANGTILRATGMTWRGKLGGLWAEMDELPNAEAAKDNFGWALVEGTGFGVSGPLLLDASAGKAVQAQVSLGREIVFECMMPRSSTVGQLVRTMCARTKLAPKQVILTRGQPPVNPATGMVLPHDFTDTSDILKLEQTLGDAFNGEAFNLIYTGDFKEDYHRPGLEDARPRPPTPPSPEHSDEEEDAPPAAPEPREPAEDAGAPPLVPKPILPSRPAAEPALAAEGLVQSYQASRRRAEPDGQVGDGKTTCMWCGARATTNAEKAAHLREAKHDGFYMGGG